MKESHDDSSSFDKISCDSLNHADDGGLWNFTQPGRDGDNGRARGYPDESNLNNLYRRDGKYSDDQFTDPSFG